MSERSLYLMAVMQRRLDCILQAEPGKALELLWQEYRLADRDAQLALVGAAFGRLALQQPLAGVSPREIT